MNEVKRSAHALLRLMLERDGLNNASRVDEALSRLESMGIVKPSTRRVYRYGWRDFLAWNNSHPIDEHTLARYQTHLDARDTIGIRTKNLYLSAARGLLARLFDNGIVQGTARTRVRGFRIPRAPQTNVLTEADVARVFRHVRVSDDVRLPLIFALLYYQGLRPHEILALRVEGYDAAKRTLRIHDVQPDIHAIVDLHPATVDTFVQFLEVTKLTTGFVFVSSHKPTTHISNVQLGRLIRAVHVACEVNASALAWHHLFTKKLIDAGFDILTIARFTRRKSIAPLKPYLEQVVPQTSLPVYYKLFKRHW